MKAPSTREKINVTITTKPICQPNSPIIPSKKKKERKATAVVETPANTAGNTSIVPSTAASNLFNPPSNFLIIFSPIIIPSSTKIPITSIIAYIVIMFIVIGADGAKKNIPKNEIGILKATQNETLGCRNIVKNKRTNKNPIAPFLVNRSILCFKGVDASNKIFASVLSLFKLNAFT